MTAAQQRIADAVESFYDESSPLGLCVLKYKEAVGKLDAEARGDLVSKRCILYNDQQY